MTKSVPSKPTRFLAATHRDLDEMIESGEFREDLYYRLNVIPLWVAPLRERRDDIPQLAARFCDAHGEQNGRPSMRLDDAAVRLLVEQEWPGNVRELSNFIERLIVFTDGDVITRDDDVERELARHPRRRTSHVPEVSVTDTLEERRDEAERGAIREALERAGGNRTKAARLLGISRRTLYNKLAEMDEVPPKG